MATPLLQTKLYVPPARPEWVSRSRLIERLDEGLRPGRPLTLISAPAGFGKTTLLSEWIHHKGAVTAPVGGITPLVGGITPLVGGITPLVGGMTPLVGGMTPLVGGMTPPLQVAWLSLDKGDDDLARFLAYLVGALRMIPSLGEAGIGESALAMLHSPQTPHAEAVLTVLINEITTVATAFILVLDDYHLIEARPIHDALTFLLDHLPPQMHLAIATRADPPLPIARLRGRGQLIELRQTDLRFTSKEAVEFLNQVMGLSLSAEDVAALESRTEGWIVGLQLAALSLQGRADAHEFIAAFTGGHHYVLEYLVQEVVRRQTEPVQRFLMQTSILDRLCGPLCDAVRFGKARSPVDEIDGEAMLAYLRRTNLFILPLDDEHHW